MGQFEKIVVLTVLFLVAVILVISLSTREEPIAGIDGSPAADELALQEPTGELAPAPIQGRAARRGPSAPAPHDLDLSHPTETGSAVLAGEDEADALDWPDAAGNGEPEPAAETPARKTPLLSATIDQAPVATATTREPGLPAGAALLTLRDLEPTFDPELMQYVWRDGDGFASLAKRFYGDEKRASLLQLFNEGRSSVAAGEAILVPVFDRRGVTPARATAAGAAGSTYVVLEGESLWSIAKKQYGRGTDWQRIFDANRDRLTRAEDVRAGMQLVIP